MTASMRDLDVDHDLVADSRRVRSALRGLGRRSAPVRLLVSGPRGAGKTEVLQHVAADAAAASLRVEFVTPTLDVESVDGDVVLVADGLAALGPETLDALWRRAADPATSLVVATRPWPQTPSSTEIIAVLETSALSLVLGHVSRSDLLDHCSATEMTLSAACTEWILTAAGGATWLAAAAADAHDDRDCASDPTHRELARILAITVNHRMASASAAVREVVERVCAGDPVTDADHDALRHAYAEGLLGHDGLPSPIVRDAVAGGPVRPGIVASALAAWAMGDVASAAVLADRGLAGGGASPLVGIAATIWSHRGMLPVAHRLYDAHAPFAGDAGAAVAAIGVGERPAPDEVGGAGSPSTALIAADVLREGLRSSLESGRTDAAIVALTRASHLHSATKSHAPLPELPAVIGAAAAQSAGDLDRARAIIDAAIADQQGGPVAASRLMLWRGWIAMHQARSGEARDALAAAVAASVLAPRDDVMAHALRIGLIRRYGDLASLESAWRTARPVLESIDIDLYLLQPLTEYISTGARLGDTSSTDAALRAALVLLERLASPVLWSAPVWWAAIQRGILVNDPESIAPHAHALVSAAATSRPAAVMARAGQIWTTVLAGTFVGEDVEAAAVDTAAIGLTWDAARLVGAASSLTPDRRLSARLLSRARDIHPLDAARRTHTSDESDTESVVTDPSTLSARELDVARLVVEGKTYAEIGAAIFISPRTAEHHIASIRRRLGATSRSDLMAKLRTVLAGAEPVGAVA